MTQGLFGEEIGIVAGGETDEAELAGQIFDDLEGAGTDGAGAAEQDDVLHADGGWNRVKGRVGQPWWAA